MNTAIKALMIFWIGIVPLAFLVLMFGPMFVTHEQKAEPEVSRHCSLDELLMDEPPERCR